MSDVKLPRHVGRVPVKVFPAPSAITFREVKEQRVEGRVPPKILEAKYIYERLSNELIEEGSVPMREFEDRLK